MDLAQGSQFAAISNIVLALGTKKVIHCNCQKKKPTPFLSYISSLPEEVGAHIVIQTKLTRKVIEHGK